VITILPHPAPTRRTATSLPRRAIPAGGVPPDTPIPLSGLADAFEISQTPVRETLKTLMGEGLVAHRRNSGSRGIADSPRAARNVHRAETLESASLRAAVANASDADRAAVAAVNHLLEQTIADDDAVAYHRQSLQFHAALTRPSRMHRLLHMLETAWNITEPVQSMVHVSPAHRAQLHADHRTMLDASLVGDAERLVAASEVHAARLNRRRCTVVHELRHRNG
jgi:DNA-binding GntR family transcriptional regulator